MLRSIYAVVVIATLPISIARIAMSEEKRQPNILFIAVDDLNHWVHHLGRNPQAKTPNIDRLAARGMSFAQAHCVAPACNPSRAALMSGQRPSTTGCYMNADNWKKQIPPGRSLAATFKQAGYHVAGAGKIYHSDSYYESEWSEYMDRSLYSRGASGVDKYEGFHDPLAHDLKDEDINDWQIVDWCIERVKTKNDKPLFLACGVHKPHLPFAVPRKYYDMFPLDEIELPPTIEDDLSDIPSAGVRMAKPTGDHAKFLQSGRWKAAIQSYLATVAYTDRNIGRLLDAVEQGPYRDDMIIVLWGDHGWHFGEKEHWRKFTLWEEATRAPLIWSVPGVTPTGEVCRRPVDFLSIYPTLCELAGIAVPGHVEGRSIKTLLANGSAEWDAKAVCTHGFKNHAVRTDRWRYIRYADGSEELYDHNKDPYEWVNLANQDQYSDVKQELAQLLPEKNAPKPSVGKTRRKSAAKKKTTKSN